MVCINAPKSQSKQRDKQKKLPSYFKAQPINKIHHGQSNLHMTSTCQKPFSFFELVYGKKMYKVLIILIKIYFPPNFAWKTKQKIWDSSFFFFSYTNHMLAQYHVRTGQWSRTSAKSNNLYVYSKVFPFVKWIYRKYFSGTCWLGQKSHEAKCFGL